MTLSKGQKDALNRARVEASEIRKRMESMQEDSFDRGSLNALAVEVTNMMCDLERELKRGDKQ